MRVLIRADASTDIGAGHIVRCATLARQLIRAGHTVYFLCRRHPGNLVSWLEAEGFEVGQLPEDTTDEESDTHHCLNHLSGQTFDWIVVDHYQLGIIWERKLAQVGKVMVIDDLARNHACDLLLDQNALNPLHAHYPARISPNASLLLGPAFALVRPEFSALRQATLRRKRERLERLLICMGANDPENETSKVLAGVALSHLQGLNVDVVIGSGNPHRDAIEDICTRRPNTYLHVQTNRMAELMAAADCAINAGGSTTWERCTLALPGIVTICADNQVEIVQAVGRAGAHHSLGWHTDLSAEDYARVLADLSPARLKSMSQAAARICDGLGAVRVGACLLQQ